MPRLSSVEWGSVGEWLVLITFAAGVFTYALDYLRRIREHAERVNPVPVSAFRYAKGNSSANVKYVVINTGPDPVYELRVDLLDWEWNQKRNRRRCTPLRSQVIAVLPPDHSPDYAEMTEIDASDLKPPKQGFLLAPLRIEFRDSAGRRWRKDPDGKLTRVGGSRLIWWRVHTRPADDAS